ncbi:hypothetical protein JCM8547_001723 [Rhodosporidiobolus lusitaniae]
MWAWHDWSSYEWSSYEDERWKAREVWKKVGPDTHSNVVKYWDGLLARLDDREEKELSEKYASYLSSVASSCSHTIQASILGVPTSTIEIATTTSSVSPSAVRSYSSAVIAHLRPTTPASLTGISPAVPPTPSPERPSDPMIDAWRDELDSVKLVLTFYLEQQIEAGKIDFAQLKAVR